MYTEFLLIQVVCDLALYRYFWTNWSKRNLTSDSLWCHGLCVLSGHSRNQLFVTLWTVARLASLSMGFSRQEYWSGLPCLPLGELPNSGIELTSHSFPALWVDSLPLSQPWRPWYHGLVWYNFHFFWEWFWEYNPFCKF